MPPETRRRSLGDRLIAVTVVPTVVLLLLWTVAASTFLNDMLDLNTSADFVEEVGDPLLVMVAALQHERHYALRRFGEIQAGRAEGAANELQPAEELSDDSIATFHQHLARVDLHRFSDDIRDRIGEFEEAIDEVVANRELLGGLRHDHLLVAGPYDEAVDAGLRVWSAHTELSDPGLEYEAETLEAMLRAREQLAREHALHTYARTAGTFSSAVQADFAETIGARRFLSQQIETGLRGEEVEIHQSLLALEEWGVLHELENEAITASPDPDQPPLGLEPWSSSYSVVSSQYWLLERSRVESLTTENRAAATTLMWQVGGGTLLALAAVIASAVFIGRTTRDISRRLGKLRDSTLEHAQQRLPAAIQRLRSGEEVDVARVAPELPVHRRDEIGQAVEAFNLAQRTAVEEAVAEARLREGVRSVFRNIARRTQGLVHRQLGLLDELEQAETDPKALESLFRIDHLSTQLRRNADNLILLSGTRPDRRRRAPVTLQNVVRAAAGEIQDYTRINVLPMPDASVDGRAAGDLVHLLAELLDNAASFSPPTAPVTIRGSALASGYALEVEDRGLGMSEGDYENLNRILATAPEFDVADMSEDSRLGMFVISNIANRFGMQVTLRPSPYNGTQAIVVLPESLIVEDAPAAAEELRDPAAPSPGRPTRREGSLPGPAPLPAADGAAGALATAVAISPPEPARQPPPESAPPQDTPALRAESGSDDPSETYKGLPRRRRARASSTPAPPSQPQAAEPRSRPRSLEEIQRMMSSFQRGTQRGRAAETDADTDPRDS